MSPGPAAGTSQPCAVPPPQVVAGTRELVSSTVTGAREAVSGAVGLARGAVQGSVERTRRALSTGISTVAGSRVGQLLATGADTVLEKSEELVEHYLPGTDEEPGECWARRAQNHLALFWGCHPAGTAPHPQGSAAPSASYHRHSHPGVVLRPMGPPGCRGQSPRGCSMATRSWGMRSSSG